MLKLKSDANQVYIYIDLMSRFGIVGVAHEYYIKNSEDCVTPFYNTFEIL